MPQQRENSVPPAVVDSETHVIGQPLIQSAILGAFLMILEREREREREEEAFSV